MKIRFTIALAAVLALAGCGSSKPQALTVTGSVQTDGITHWGQARVGGPCTPDAGFEDAAGAQVTVADDAGKTLAIGKMTTEGKFGSPVWVKGGMGPCLFAFAVPDVPAGLAFYTVTVGRRGSQKLSGSEIARPLALTLR